MEDPTHGNHYWTPFLFRQFKMRLNKWFWRTKVWLCVDHIKGAPKSSIFINSFLTLAATQGLPRGYPIYPESESSLNPWIRPAKNPFWSVSMVLSYSSSFNSLMRGKNTSLSSGSNPDPLNPNSDSGYPVTLYMNDKIYFFVILIFFAYKRKANLKWMLANKLFRICLLFGLL